MRRDNDLTGEVPPRPSRLREMPATEPATTPTRRKK